MVAPWLAPYYPNSCGPLPDRARELASIAAIPVGSPKRGWLGDQDRARSVLDKFLAENSCFLNGESQFNTFGHPWVAITSAAEDILGDNWFLYPKESILEAVFDHKPEWNNAFVHMADLQLFAFALETSQRLAAKHAHPEDGPVSLALSTYAPEALD